MQYDPLNLVAIMVTICDTFGLSHPQMIALRRKVEMAYRTQLKMKPGKNKPPVSVNAVAIVTGLLVGFGGVEAVLKLRDGALVSVAREYDPFGRVG